MTLREIALILVTAPLLFACGNANDLSEEPVATEEVQEAIVPAPAPDVAAEPMISDEALPVEKEEPTPHRHRQRFGAECRFSGDFAALRRRERGHGAFSVQ